MQYALIRWVDPRVMFQEEKNHLESWPKIKKKKSQTEKISKNLKRKQTNKSTTTAAQRMLHGI